MTEQEALKAARKMLPEAVFRTVTEYKNWFVFGVDAAKSGLMHPVAVDKTSGIPMIFHPMTHEPEAYFKAVKENSRPLRVEHGYDEKVERGKDVIAHALGLK